MSTPEIARLLRAIADVIERSSSSEISEFAKKISQNSGMREESSSTKRKTKENDGADLSVITQRILDANDRTVAISILKEARLSRKNLVKLGHDFNVHIVKEDKVDFIETKIVETLVGSRLSSKAIRGDS